MKTNVTLGLLAATVWVFSSGVWGVEGEGGRRGEGRRGAHHGPHHAKGGPLKGLIEHKKEWGLSDEQVEKLEKLMKDSKDEAEKVHEKMSEAHQNLRKSAHGDEVNEAAITAAAADLGKAIAEMAQFRKKQKEKLSGILTEEQLTKLQEKHEEMRRRFEKGEGDHGRRGRGGPPGKGRGEAPEKEF